MSATKAWTKAQIDEAKKYGKTVSELIRYNEDLSADYYAIAILYDALEAAEHERDNEGRECMKAIQERDEAEDCVSAIAALCDQEMSSSFGYQDLVDEVDETLQSIVNAVYAEERANRAEYERDDGEKMLQALKEALLKAEHKWISVKERLPPLEVPFDVWDSYHQERVANHGPFTGAWDDDFRRSVLLARGFTHWRPLPEPPQIESEEVTK